MSDLPTEIADIVANRLQDLIVQSRRAFIDGLAPTKAHDTDAAFDLRAAEPNYVLPGQAQLVKCGFTIAIPDGYVGLVCSRSGLALEHRVFVLNAPGVIDPGYRGEVGVILFNAAPPIYDYDGSGLFVHNTRDIFAFEAGDRIAQLLILSAPSFTLIQNKNAFGSEQTDRGEAGFGSTGVA